MYIGHVYNIIRVRADVDVAFKYSYRDTEKDALGKLIVKFDKLSNRDDLVKELKDLVSFRNKIAHEAFLHTVEQQEDIKYLDEQTDTFRALRERTKLVVAAINKEVGRIEKISKTHNKEAQKGHPGQSASEQLDGN